MSHPVDWENRIGRRLRLRDLHVFFTVVQWGSMAKAAGYLGISQPSVSEVIAGLEHTLGVPLLERSPKGVHMTLYGRALHTRAHAAFDELRQGVRDIEFLADPTAGEVRMGCPESIAAAFLPPVIEEFTRDYPGVALYVEQVTTPTFEFPELRARKFDFIIARLPRPRGEESFSDDVEIEAIFDDEYIVVAGNRSRWAEHPSLDIADLTEAAWILSPEDTWGRRLVEEAFRARGMDKPKVVLTTFSVHLRFHLAAVGDYVTAIPRSIFHPSEERFGLSALPVRLPNRPWPVNIVTLKHRTLSPVVALFLDRLRTYVQSIASTGPSTQERSAS
jgi:DNA-binding transcriptional LysR family regulator